MDVKSAFLHGYLIEKFILKNLPVYKWIIILLSSNFNPN